MKNDIAEYITVFEGLSKIYVMKHWDKFEPQDVTITRTDNPFGYHVAGKFIYQNELFPIANTPINSTDFFVVKTPGNEYIPLVTRIYIRKSIIPKLVKKKRRK